MCISATFKTRPIMFDFNIVSEIITFEDICLEILAINFKIKEFMISSLQ